jgi:hypothetical protein
MCSPPTCLIPNSEVEPRGEPECGNMDCLVVCLPLLEDIQGPDSRWGIDRGAFSLGCGVGDM